MRGVGDKLDALTVPSVSAVLVNPGTHVPTRGVFQAMTHAENPPMPSEVPDGTADTWIEWLADQRNDLEPAAVSLAPQIGDVLRALRSEPHVRVARMSGSGATCFALVPTAAIARRIAASIADRFPDWWVRATVLS